MKRRLIMLVALAIGILTACQTEDMITRAAIAEIRRYYSDYRQLILCRIDTVTYGDNLEWRIEQAKRSLVRAESMSDEYSIGLYRKRVAALDSLKATSGEILGRPTAYTCCVIYNSPTNMAWAQLDRFGRLLHITKDPSSLLINPGEDIPGYFKIVSGEGLG